jgi:hypothetical protein
LGSYLRLPDYRKHLGEIPVIKQHLKTLCALRLGEPDQAGRTKRRLALFVDDLDRCSPGRITDVFDAIRLIMDVPGVIVVVMIDPRVAMRAVADEYQPFAQEGRDKFAIARDYLGKIIQLPIALRPVGGEKLEEFITRRLFPDVFEESGKVGTEAMQGGAGGEASAWEKKPSGSEEKPPEPETERGGSDTKPAGHEREQTESEPDTRKEEPVEAEATDLDALDEEMKDTARDRDDFVRWARLYQMSNPRRLLRLRNSCRFLKGWNRAGGFDLDPRRMLALLFWLEYLNELPPELHRQCQAGLEKEWSPESEVDEGTREIVDAARRQWQELFGQPFSESKEGTLISLVERVILPYHEPDPRNGAAAVR